MNDQRELPSKTKITLSLTAIIISVATMTYSSIMSYQTTQRTQQLLMIMQTKATK